MAGSFWRGGGFRGRASRDAPIAGRARCQSARQGQRERERVDHRVATTKPTPPPRHSAAALRPGALPTAGSTNQARRMFRVKHLFLFPFDAYLPGTWQRASRCRADRLFGFWAQNGTHANVARGELGSQQLGGSRDLGICRASFRKPGAPGPKRRSELAWVPFCAHIACGPPDGPGCFT